MHILKFPVMKIERMRTSKENKREFTENQTVVDDDAKEKRTDSKVSDIDHNYFV